VEPQGHLVRPGNRPGLGIEINEAEVKKHPFEQEVLQRSFHGDGSVADW
jgi:galactonate dehydratase